MPKNSIDTAPALNLARKHGHAIEAASANIEILMQSIFDKVGMTSNIDPITMHVMDAVSCYADCALKQLIEINDSREQMMEIIANVMNGGKDA